MVDALRRNSVFVFVVAGAVACGADNAPEEVSGEVALTSQNNYSLSNTISIPRITTAAATDLNICWGEAVRDIQCHDIDPQTDIQNVTMIRFAHLSPEEIEERIRDGALQQADMDGYVQFLNEGQSCAALSSMSFFGTAIDVVNEYTTSGGTYMLVLTEGTTPGVGAKIITFVEPSDGSDNTDVSLAEGCGVIDASADFRSLEAVPVPAEPPWTVDWAQVATDGQGNSLDAGKIDRVMLAFYEGKTLEGLERELLDLEISATALWEKERVSGSSVLLEELTSSSSGAGFEGFSAGGGVWILALSCSRCPNPAPLVLTVLEPVQ